MPLLRVQDIPKRTPPISKKNQSRVKMALISTSQKPSEETIKLADFLAKLIPTAEFERRGAKTIKQLVRLARKMGHSRIILVTKGFKHPSSLQFINVSQTEWEWRKEIVNVKKYTHKKITENHSLESTSELAELFEFESSRGDTILRQEGNLLYFISNKKKLLEIVS